MSWLTYRLTTSVGEHKMKSVDVTSFTQAAAFVNDAMEEYLSLGGSCRGCVEIGYGEPLYPIWFLSKNVRYYGIYPRESQDKYFYDNIFIKILAYLVFGIENFVEMEYSERNEIIERCKKILSDEEFNKIVKSR